MEVKPVKSCKRPAYAAAALVAAAGLAVGCDMDDGRLEGETMPLQSTAAQTTDLVLSGEMAEETTTFELDGDVVSTEPAEVSRTTDPVLGGEAAEETATFQLDGDVAAVESS